MISLGSIHGRKGIGLGFGVGREMEETELEEGEACYHQNDDDSSINPDFALSHIDEKLQDVLGHLQKDFEGEVSAENLGAKFGAYGSFLPADQRSPTWSHPRTTPKVHNYTTPRPPSNLHVEGGHHKPAVSSSASLSVRLEPASAIAPSLPALKAPSVNDSVKQDVCVLSTNCTEVPTSKYERVKNSSNPSDQKTLKVRIKVGSDHLLTRTKAEIYSGLGLDVSPSSSLGDSPAYSEGLSPERQDGPEESPTSILKIMTAFPVLGSLLLSPLPDDLICLTERKELLRESRSLPVHKGSQKSSGRDDKKKLQEKKPKSFKKNAFPVELKNGNVNDAREDSLACEELVSNASKLPRLSNQYCDFVDSSKATVAVDISTTSNNGGVKDDSFVELSDEKTLEPVFGREVWHVEKVGAAGKILDSKKANSHAEDPVYPRKGENLKEEKTDVSAKPDTSVSQERKTLNTEFINAPQQEAGQKAISHKADGMELAPGNKKSSSGGKKKSKGNRSCGAHGAEVVNDSLKIDSKSRKSSQANRHVSQSEINDVRKDYEKAKDRYKNFFGDLELEHGDESGELPSMDRTNDKEGVKRSTLELKSTSKKQPNGKKIDRPSSVSCPRAASNMAPLSGKEPVSDAAPATEAPALDAYWVGCDKCEKWRLLPVGTNPKSLPEKWMCSMLDWLPGMNRCSISEDETTNAAPALYRVPAPAPQYQSNQHGHPGEVLSGDYLAGAPPFDQNSVPAGGKKKYGLKDASYESNHDGPTQFPSFTKKNLQASGIKRSLNGVNHSLSGNELESQHFGQSSSLVVGKYRQKQKEKNKQLEKHSDEGDTKSSKRRKKREIDQDCVRAFKKIKSDGSRYSDKDWVSDHGGAVLKTGPNSSSGLSINMSGKDKHKQNDCSKDAKCDSKDNLQVSVRYPKEQIQMASDDGSLHMGKSDDRDVKTRKVKRCQNTQIYSVTLPGTGHHPQDNRDFMEGTSENGHRSEKRARISKSKWKETSASNGNVGTDENDKSIKDQHLGPDYGGTLSQPTFDNINSFKRDLGSVQPSVAATSSSSKVSGPHKNRVNFRQVKGSPVESVSSSPLRILNPDKLESSRTSLAGKDDSQYDGIFAPDSPRRCSDGQQVSDRSGTVRKDEIFSVTHPGFLESSGLDFQDRELGCVSGSKTKSEIIPSPEFATCYTDCDSDTLHQGTQYPCKPHASYQCHDAERRNKNESHANGSRPWKSRKGSSSCSKDKTQSFISEIEKGKAKSSDSFNEFIDDKPYDEKSKAGRKKYQEKFGINSDKVETKIVSKKDSASKLLNESAKRERQSKFGGHANSAIRVGATSSQNTKENPLLDHDGERSSKKLFSEQVDSVEIIGRRKSHSLPPSGKGQKETVKRCPQPFSGPQKENGANTQFVDGDALNAPKQINQIENQSGMQPISSSKSTTPSRHKVKELDAPSPIPRDFSSQAATNALKEAKNLKHLADRLKNSGSNLEGTGLYFQAALKFLHGASLLESCNNANTMHGEMIQSMEIYSSTAKLCEFCAHEYEKSKDMAAAALAYKCMEVAYMRVLYSTHTNASRDGHELQTALQIVPPGESPSSSVSDVDNLNNAATMDKVSLGKGFTSPQVTGNHVITARNRSSFVRLLNFTRDVDFAMEASKKSRIAFVAINPKLEKGQYGDGISSIKRALDFNFHDLEGLLRMVRLAMESINC